MPRPVDQGGLSVYDVEDAATAKRVAVIKRLVENDRPDKIDYVLLPQACFALPGLTVVPEADDAAPPFLSERHRNVLGIASPEIAADLADAANASGMIVERIGEPALLLEAAVAVATMPNLRQWITSSHWRLALGLADA